MTCDIAGHQVRGELDTCEVAVKAAGQGAYQQGLAQAGNAFEQHMAAGDQRSQYVIDHRILANHRLAQFGAQRLGQLGGPPGVEGVG